MIKKALIGILFIQVSFHLHAMQPADTVVVKKRETGGWEKQQILPISLIAAGAVLNAGEIKERVHSAVPRYYTSMDDWFQYAPAAQMYIADLFTTEHRSSVFDQTKYFLIATFASGMIVGTLKEITSVTRPDGTPRAWPSGHTTQAFVSATVLYKEFHDTRPFLAASGYFFATATGMLRMTNNRHWLPDVVAGAGLGILVVNVVYLVEPFKEWQPFGKNGSEVSLTAFASPGGAGIRLTW